MELENLLHLDNNYSIKNAYDFEAFVVNLFERDAKREGADIKDISNRKAFGDFIIEGEYRKLKGPTLVEVKINLNNTYITSLNNKIPNAENDNEIKIETILFISAQKVNNKAKIRYQDLIKKIRNDIEVVIWGPDELNKIINKNKKIVNELNSDVLSFRINSALKFSSQDWRTTRDEIINDIKKEYSNGKMSLFLGAGVSSSAGLPDWNTLINTLFVRYLSEVNDGDSKIDNLNEIIERLNYIDSKSALMSTRYIKKGFDGTKNHDSEFYNEVRKVLYDLRDEDHLENSNLIKAINNMCISKRDGAKVKSIITYNFDDLIERNINSDINRFKCIYLDTDNFENNELPIYHVHGFLPKNPEEYPQVDKCTLVFSEEGYHKIYSDPYHWSNLVQLNTLRDNTCLMIGLSLTDPNFRRLLEIASSNKEETQHYAFLQRLSFEKFVYDKEEKVLDSDEDVNQFLIRHHVLNEEILKDLGVKIIWYEKHEEIPDFINEIYRI